MQPLERGHFERRCCERWKSVTSPTDRERYVRTLFFLSSTSCSRLCFANDHISRAEWFFPEVYGNKHVVRIISNILGPRPEVHFIRSNTLLATQDRQLVHADILCEHPEHPFGIAYNTCLVDVRPENGTTELWLGTQNTNLTYHVRNGDPSIAEDRLDERRKVRPPCYPTIKKGSIVLRDLRLW